MELPVFTAFALLEILFVGLLYAAYLHFHNRHKQTIDDETAEPSAADQYAACLHQAILQADARLAGMRDGNVLDKRRLVETRLAFLKAEHAAVDRSGQDEEKLWSLLEEPLLLLTPGDDHAISPLVESLQMQVRSYEKRLANLEQFRDLFFELKGKVGENSVRGENLKTEVQRMIPDEDQSPELKSMLEELERENRQMSAQLENVEAVFSDILHKVSEPVEADSESIAGSMSGIDQSVESIRSIISMQESRIAELAALIAQQETELSSKEKLEQVLETLTESNRELETVITVVEEENLFLQEQISMLLTQELEKDRKDSEEKEALREECLAQQKAYVELSDKFAAMEKEYLQIYEEHHRMKRDGEERGR
ncbi:MAG: hypothetical protein ACE5FQ_02275 [Thiogranum sp.]